MSQFDIPAVIKFILSKTGRDKLIYIGYSMGCSMFFAAMAMQPELNSKIDVMIGMAPAVSLAHLSSPAIKKIAPYVKHLEVGTAFQYIFQKKFQKQFFTFPFDF